MTTDSLTVDFTDRANVRAQLPHAREILERKQAAYAAMREEVTTWNDLVVLLERLAGGDGAPAPADTPDRQPAEDAPPAAAVAPVDQPLELVVEVVNRELRPIRSKDVAKILRNEGHEFENVTVSNALHYAAVRAKPPRVKRTGGRGFYAPLDYEPQPVGRSLSMPYQIHPEGS